MVPACASRHANMHPTSTCRQVKTATWQCQAPCLQAAALARECSGAPCRQAPASCRLTVRGERLAQLGCLPKGPGRPVVCSSRQLAENGAGPLCCVWRVEGRAIPLAAPGRRLGARRAQGTTAVATPTGSLASEVEEQVQGPVPASHPLTTQHAGPSRAPPGAPAEARSQQPESSRPGGAGRQLAAEEPPTSRAPGGGGAREAGQRDLEGWIRDTVGMDGRDVVRQVAQRKEPHFLAPFGRRRNLPIFLYLPGLDGTGVFLDHQLDSMQELFDVRSLAIPPSDASSYPELADRVAALLEYELALRGCDSSGGHSGPPRPASWRVTVMAESFGAGVAVHLAADHAHLVQFLIISNSGSGLRRQPFLQYASLIVPHLPVAPGLHSLASYGIAPVLSAWDRVAEKNRHLIVPPFSSELLPPEAFATRFQTMATWRPADALLARVAAETLLIASGGDCLFPSVEEAFGLATCIPRCRVRVLPFSGHVAFLEEDVNLRELLREAKFLPEAPSDQGAVPPATWHRAEPLAAPGGEGLHVPGAAAGPGAAGALSSGHVALHATPEGEGSSRAANEGATDGGSPAAAEAEAELQEAADHEVLVRDWAAARARLALSSGRSAPLGGSGRGKQAGPRLGVDMRALTSVLTQRGDATWLRYMFPFSAAGTNGPQPLPPTSGGSRPVSAPPPEIRGNHRKEAAMGGNGSWGGAGPAGLLEEGSSSLSAAAAPGQLSHAGGPSHEGGGVARGAGPGEPATWGQEGKPHAHPGGAGEAAATWRPSGQGEGDAALAQRHAATWKPPGGNLGEMHGGSSNGAAAGEAGPQHRQLATRQEPPPQPPRAAAAEAGAGSNPGGGGPPGGGGGKGLAPLERPVSRAGRGLKVKEIEKGDSRVEGSILREAAAKAQANLLADVPLYRAWNWLSRPAYYGLDNIPKEGPILFVGNHTLFGIYDMPLMLYELQKRRGLTLRGLAHEHHWDGPIGPVFSRYGAVKATPKNCFRLLADGEAVLLYPGGGREVAKRRGERYQLMWKEETDFVRMALRFGATIVPFSSIGVEDAFDILLEPQELMSSPLGDIIRPALKIAGLTAVEFPLATGGGLLPRPERLYFNFSEPIRTDQYSRAALKDPELCSRLYQEAKGAVEGGIELLKEKRANDPMRDVFPRTMLNILEGWDGL